MCHRKLCCFVRHYRRRFLMCMRVMLMSVCIIFFISWLFLSCVTHSQNTIFVCVCVFKYGSRLVRIFRDHKMTNCANELNWVAREKRSILCEKLARSDRVKVRQKSQQTHINVIWKEPVLDCGREEQIWASIVERKNEAAGGGGVREKRPIWIWEKRWSEKKTYSHAERKSTWIGYNIYKIC